MFKCEQYAAGPVTPNPNPNPEQYAAGPVTPNPNPNPKSSLMSCVFTVDLLMLCSSVNSMLLDL